MNDKTVPQEIIEAFADADKYFPTELQKFQFFDKYSRFNYDKNRRETWIETVDRAVTFLKDLSQHKLSPEEYVRMRTFILGMKATPSMRLIAMAGEAAKRQNISLYNCSYLPMDSINSFVEELIIAMAGCVSGDTLIQTIEGPKRADTLKDIAYTAIVDGKEFFAPKGTFVTGVKQLYKLQTKLGYEMRLTEEHPLLTKSGWKQLGQLSVGDEIRLSQQDVQSAITWIGGGGSFGEGYLCGIFIGDGEWKRDKEAMACVKDGDKGHEGIMQEAEAAIQTISRKSGAGGWYRHRNGYDLSIGTMVTQFGITRESTKIGDGLRGKAIPESVELTSSEFQKGFLRGMFDTDGGLIMNNKHRRVMLFQSYRPNLVRVQRMLARFGIRSKITKRSDAGKMKFPGDRECFVQERWMLSVVRDSIPVFAKQIGFSHLIKKEKLQTAIRVAKHWTHSQEFDAIVAIEKDVEEEVFDTLIEGIHAFDANGIYVHNCGVGFSVEKQYVDKLPRVKEQIGLNGHTPYFIIDDSTEGWAEALRYGLEAWFAGKDVHFDYSNIRPAGSPLKVKGGRASGPEPFKDLLDFTRERILARQGEKLRSLDAHDIACKIGEAIVSGGVRRTALISLFDIDDQEMVNCKTGENLVGNEQRWMANNSAVWTDDVSDELIQKQMEEMRAGQRGEPGIFSRYNANRIIPERRARFGYKDYGTNPCGEINLRPFEFCNLSIAVARYDDTLETLKEKVEVATIIGTIQSMGTNFPGLRDIWKKNCEEERLLGVDINGWVDCPLLRPDNPDLANILEELKNHAIEINKKYAQLLGINQSVSVTCVKPSGNSSQLFNCSSGIHARHYPHYVRNARVQAQSPLRRLMQDQGVPMDVENGQTKENATAYVVHFPVASPEGVLLKDNMSAVEQCDHWLTAKLYWTEHNPSVTISYKEEEFVDLVRWVCEHKQYIGGMSFLPAFDAQYEQMPYEHVSAQEYQILAKAFPHIDFAQLYNYEKEDYTSASQELACVSGACSIEEYQALKKQRELSQSMSINVMS